MGWTRGWRRGRGRHRFLSKGPSRSSFCFCYNSDVRTTGLSGGAALPSVWLRDGYFSLLLVFLKKSCWTFSPLLTHAHLRNVQIQRRRGEIVTPTPAPCSPIARRPHSRCRLRSVQTFAVQGSYFPGCAPVLSCCIKLLLGNTKLQPRKSLSNLSQIFAHL